MVTVIDCPKIAGAKTPIAPVLNTPLLGEPTCSICAVSKFLTIFLFQNIYLAHVIEQPNFRIPNPQYLQRNFCFDFFNDSENTF